MLVPTSLHQINIITNIHDTTTYLLSGVSLQSINMDQISLSIPKFSYATSTIPSSSSAAWTHITSAGHSNLKADFYIQGTGGFIQKTRTLRISRDHEVLENLDLNWLAQEVAHSAAAMGSGATSVRSPIAVIVKSPCLAVRYQTNQQV